MTDTTTTQTVEITRTDLAQHLRKAEWSTPGAGVRFLAEVEHTCGHWEATVQHPNTLAADKALLAKLAGQECLKCANRRYARVQRAARKAGR